MALTDKLTAIADAIREKTSTTSKLTLDAMPTIIRTISGGGGGKAITVTFSSTTTAVFTYTTASGGIGTVSLSKSKQTATVTDILENSLICCGNAMGTTAYPITSDAMIPASQVTPYTHKAVAGITYTRDVL